MQWLLAVVLCFLAACVQKEIQVPVVTAPPVVAPTPAPAAPVTETPPPAEECQATAPAAPEVVTMRMVRLPAPNFLADRVAFYEQELQRLQEEPPVVDSPCPQLAEQALAAYRELAFVGGDYAVEDSLAGDPWAGMVADIAYLRNGCAAAVSQRAVERDDTRIVAGEDAAMADGTVVAFHEMGRWQDSVTAYENLRQVFPDWQPSSASRNAYADALAKLGRAREAAAVLEEIAAEVQDPVRRFALQRRVADLLLAAGDRDAASERYENLVTILAPLRAVDAWVDSHAAVLRRAPAGDPALSVYQLVLWEYFLFDGHRLSRKMELALEQLQTFFHDSPLRQHAEQLVDEVRRTIYDRAQERLAALALAVDERDFGGATRIEEEIRSYQLTVEQQAEFDRLVETRRARQEAERRRRAAEEEERLAAAWQRAEGLFEERRWDAAIEAYGALLASSYGERAKARIVQAADRAAGELRHQAATLFLRARKGIDPEKKRQFLEEALQRLDTAARRYPQTSLMAKILANRAVIERELGKLAVPKSEGASREGRIEAE